ncbi:MAG: nucleotide exchange factor GrpE [Pirellulaceae bacterium]
MSEQKQEHPESRSPAETSHHDPSAVKQRDGDNQAQTAPNASAEQRLGEQADQTPIDAATSDVEQIEELQARLERADREVLIAQAELENYRKRTRRDVEMQVRYATVPLLQDILQVRDNLHRALEVKGSDESGESDGLRAGVAMVARMLDDALSKHGCTAIPAVGEEFDPNYHEAISQVPSDEHPAGVVAHEAVTGFRLYDRVVRPSQVVVSTGPATT